MSTGVMLYNLSLNVLKEINRDVKKLQMKKSIASMCICQTVLKEMIPDVKRLQIKKCIVIMCICQTVLKLNK